MVGLGLLSGVEDGGWRMILMEFFLLVCDDWWCGGLEMEMRRWSRLWLMVEKPSTVERIFFFSPFGRTRCGYL